MTMKRERIEALQALYSLSFSARQDEEELARVFNKNMEAFCAADGEENAEEWGLKNMYDVPAAGEEEKARAWKLAKGVWTHTQGLDKLLAKYSVDRPLNRVSHMERLILQLALYELIYLHYSPAQVKKGSKLLASEFSVGQNRNFIDRILAAAVKDLQASATSPQQKEGDDESL